MITNNGLQYKLYSYNSILEQFDKGSVPFGVQSSKSYRRIVLMAAYADDGGFVISYNLDDKYFVVTKESAKFSYITRGVNWLFGEKGPQEKFKTDDIYIKLLNMHLIVLELFVIIVKVSKYNKYED